MASPKLERMAERVALIPSGKPEHTPGPWYVVPTLTGALSINKDKKVPIATVGGASWHLGAEMCEANARLIAAAPDLLAALKECLEWCADDGDLGENDTKARLTIWKDVMECRAKMLRAAIAKAEGKS